ncbi:MAG: glycosyltransferase [Balneolaceae bacterium]
MINSLKIAFFGSSLLSSYWNGAATYYRGIVKALADKGHRTIFFEPDVYQRQQNRDIENPDWADVRVYAPTKPAVCKMLEQAGDADLIVKASGVGIFDEFLEKEVLHLKQNGQRVVFWDVDAPATLDRVQKDEQDAFRDLIPEYDLIFTYGGGEPVVQAYEQLGCRECIPVYNALDASTHYPVVPEEQFKCDLAFLGNRLPDREARVEEYFFKPAQAFPSKKFLIGGSGWGDKTMNENISYLGHVSTNHHNAFNCTAKTVLNISRESMARYGFSPATRVFEAAGAGACIVSDYWEGMELFLEPGEEVLVAKSGEEVTEIVNTLTEEKATEIGRAALERVLSEHTYAHRAEQIESVLGLKQTVT